MNTFVIFKDVEGREVILYPQHISGMIGMPKGASPTERYDDKDYVIVMADGVEFLIEGELVRIHAEVMKVMNQ